MEEFRRRSLGAVAENGLKGPEKGCEKNRQMTSGVRLSDDCRQYEDSHVDVCQSQNHVDHTRVGISHLPTKVYEGCQERDDTVPASWCKEGHPLLLVPFLQLLHPRVFRVKVAAASWRLLGRRPCTMLDCPRVRCCRSPRTAEKRLLRCLVRRRLH